MLHWEIIYESIRAVTGEKYFEGKENGKIRFRVRVVRVRLAPRTESASLSRGKSCHSHTE
jgi:hypothetical protein